MAGRLVLSVTLENDDNDAVLHPARRYLSEHLDQLHVVAVERLELVRFQRSKSFSAACRFSAIR